MEIEDTAFPKTPKKWHDNSKNASQRCWRGGCYYFPMKLFGYLWALPVTVVGLLFAVFACITGGNIRLNGGVVEVSGGIPGRLLRGGRFYHGGAAATLGHVILARDIDCLARSRKHELQHVRQFERWGILLLPTYWLIGIWLKMRGLHPYLDHPFEPPLEELGCDRS